MASGKEQCKGHPRTEEKMRLPWSPELKEARKGRPASSAPVWLFHGEEDAEMNRPEGCVSGFSGSERTSKGGMVDTSRWEGGCWEQGMGWGRRRACDLLSWAWWAGCIAEGGRYTRSCPAVRDSSACPNSAGTGAGSWINEPEAAWGVRGFGKFPGAPARDTETQRRASVNGL